MTLALGETAIQHIRNAQRLNDSLAQIQKEQRFFALQLQNLAKAHTQLKHDVGELSGQTETTDPEPPAVAQTPPRTVH